LQRLSVADYSDLKAPHRPFAARAAAVACLGLIAPDIPELSAALPQAAVYFHLSSLEAGWDVLHVDLTPTVTRFAEDVARHELAPQLIALLVECLHEYREHQAHPIESPLADWHFRLADLCADWLAALAARVSDPLSILSDLPDDWPALRACAAIVEAGKATKGIVDHGLRICAPSMRVAGNISGDRDRYLSLLRTRGLLPEDAIAASVDAFAAQSATARLDTAVQISPDDLFERLHQSVSQKNAVAFLWEWSCESRHWRSVLLGHVHRVCFSSASLSPSRCRDLCDMVLEAARTLDSSPLARQNAATFAFLRELGRVDTVSPPITFAADFLSQSQHAAVELLKADVAQDLPSEEWLSAFVERTDGWLEDIRHWVEDGQLYGGSGRGVGTVYFPPALRIALAAVGARASVGDFANRWMTERAQVRRCISEATPRDWIQQIIRERPLNERERDEIRSGIAKLDEQIGRTPRDADLWQTKGYLHLLLGECEAARSSLVQCLELPSHSPSTIRFAHYNLACALARLGNYDGCRSELRTLAQLGYRTRRDNLLSDPDFLGVREETWFQEVADALQFEGATSPTRKGDP
jgi:hypothetical protein